MSQAPQRCSVAMRDGASQEWHGPSVTRAPGPSCSWRAPQPPSGAVSFLSPSLGQDFVPGVWTGLLSCPTCCQGFPCGDAHPPCPRNGAARVQPGSRSAWRGLQHKHFPGGCRKILCQVWCRARLGAALLGTARSRVEQKEVSDTQNSSVPASHDRKRLFCTGK